MQSGLPCVTVVRPSALMGYSPRPRLDLTVNILTTHAVVNGVMEVWGGTQSRCSLHVEDMAELAGARRHYQDGLEVGGETLRAAIMRLLAQQTPLPPRP